MVQEEMMMGYMRHHAIVVTSFDANAIKAASCRALDIGLTVIGPSEGGINGYRTILICPDGSKEGWEDSDYGDQRRKDFREWMNEQRHEDGSNNLEWIEVAYGSDDRTAKIEATGWMVHYPKKRRMREAEI